MLKKLKDIKRIIVGAYGYKFTSHPEAIAPSLLSVRGIIKNDEGKYLIVQRSKSDRKDSLLWEFPGGKIDRGEYDPINTLHTEISQETNLNIEVQNKSPYCAVRKAKMNMSPYKDFILITLFYKCIATTQDLKISYEHEGYKWIDIKDLNKDIQFTDVTNHVLDSNYLKD